MRGGRERDTHLLKIMKLLSTCSLCLFMTVRKILSCRLRLLVSEWHLRAQALVGERWGGDDQRDSPGMPSGMCLHELSSVFRLQIMRHS